uniref:Uncharacterized protein n=1 Tax=Anopheles albimanus TaxID=7167 RepID=A0A182G0B1_ANOAL
MIDKFLRLIGISTANRNWSFWNFMFVFGITILTTYLTCIFYTCYLYRNDITKLIFCISTFGFGCQGIVRIFIFTVMRNRVITLNETNYNHYSSILNESDRVKGVVCKNLSLIYIIVKGTIYVYLMLVLAALVLPGIASFFLPERILPFGFILPALNPDEWTGYICNYMIQSTAAYYYYVMSAGSDVAIIYNLLTAAGQLDCMMVHIEELNDQLSGIGIASATNREKIVKIIKLHQFHRDYLTELMHFLYLYHVGAIGFTVLTVIISVMGVVLLRWYLGIIVSILASIQLFYICFLGTSFEMKVLMALALFPFLSVGAIKWDKLSCSEMKHMNLVLAVTQCPKLLMLVTTPLNINTYVQVHKMIYSMIMMLENTK